MKNFRMVAIILTVLLLLGTSGCSQKPAATQPTDSPKVSEPAKVIELDFSSTLPAVTSQSKIYKAWGDKIEAETGGKVKFKYYWAYSLLPNNLEIPKGVADGIADIATFPMDQSLLPLNRGIADLPFMGYPTADSLTKVWQQLYKKYPAFEAEFKALGVNMLIYYGGAGSQLHTSKKPVKTPADLKGLKITTTSDLNMIKLLGGAPVQIKPGDYYVSLERNLVEGCIQPFGFVDAMGLVPVLKHHTILGNGANSNMQGLIMNPKTYQQLPDDVKKIFDGSLIWLAEQLAKEPIATNEKTLKAAKEKGNTITVLTEKELAEWVKLTEPLHDEWIKKMEAKGLPAREIYADAKKFIAEYK